MHRAEQIRFHDTTVRPQFRAGKRTEEPDAGVVDPYIELAELFHGRFGDLRERGFVSDVRGDLHGPTSEALAGFHRIAQRFGAARGEHERSAPAGKGAGRRQPNPARRAGNDDHPARE